ncbi:Gfo/Idh/MocA family oxidoreductase [uncultured Gelidibacter sp.]|uniref:Gfo/Idh/MocA family oxidoreductase n=1 Tax=uncultured Gelidibacter sp. TaxID=259318 RepID=UPI002609C721|nr:Gfo/Idh/MocA family oxidoreductase [uncultured Gelidibacter sp.]
MKNFAMIGASGYIAPRHMKAIKETGNNLVAALDPYDGIGVMDSYFPQASFFTEFERFDRFVDKWRRDSGHKIDYVSICSPNYLHDSHIRFALRSGANAISEKPMVLNPWNLDQLKVIENETGNKINNILQLRLHPSIIALKEKVAKELEINPNNVYDIDLTYLTSRGKWYFVSWKGDEAKSGGIASNIGVHFFDMLCWIFGDVNESEVHLKTADTNAGYLQLKHAKVRWFLSVNSEYLPNTIKSNGLTTYRAITVNGEDIEFSGGFSDLHSKSYEEILKGNGFGLNEAYGSISMVSQIRNLDAIGLKGEYHPFCKLVK